MQRTFGLLLIILGVALVNAVNYCGLCKKEDHVTCHFEWQGFLGIKWKSYWDFSSPDRKYCPNYQKYGLREDEKNFIVKYHNDKRRLVASGNETRGAKGPQPAAVNIPDLEWDNELAELAEHLAYQCNWGAGFYPRYQCSNVERFAVGQNLAHEERPNNNLSIKDILDMWYNQVDRFNGNNVDEYHWDESTRHYTQMIWADTTKIGCAYINYINIYRGTRYVSRLICNYGPGGHRENQPVYRRKH